MRKKKSRDIQSILDLDNSPIVASREDIVKSLSSVLDNNDIGEIRRKVKWIISRIEEIKPVFNQDIGHNPLESALEVNVSDLEQVVNSFTAERAKHYVKRIIKGITEQRTSKFNDINLNRWKEYDYIITDSLWTFDKRERGEGHNAKYWGNFIPQIPHQLLLRFTKRGDWVLDPFMGSGTTLIECRRLGRNSVGIDLEDKAIEQAQENLKKTKDTYSSKTKIIMSDNLDVDYLALVDELGIKSFQFVLLHPPYWDIIKFSENDRNFSNFASMELFLDGMSRLAKLLRPVLGDERYLALVIGDKYSEGKWVPLGFYSMQRFLDAGFGLKSIIVKNYDMTRGKMNSSELWRYRALVGGFYVFKHEYIFLFQK
ncbi:MAG: RsmD family RNA methyltransferase [Thermoplasmatales archaeon]|nr:RsmD family RNA methyltransferase [Thermoplasmatales archaeon]MCW6170296.1 RsmD family RNA methyltransferase [Thermoplasmatales archaeon]